MSDLTTGSPPARGDDALLHDSEERLSLLLAATPDAVTFKDGAGRWLGANAAGLAVWGFAGTEWRGRDDAELAQLLPAFRDAFLECRRTDEEAWQRGETTRTDEVIGLPDGSSRTFDVIKMPLFWPDGRRRVLIILARDVTDRVAAEAELLRHAFFDRLTGLPNRALLVDRLGVALRRAAGRAGRPCAVLSLDVDRFSTVNDGIGHHAGDALLRQVARRLTAVAGPETTVARLSADEFAIVLDEVSGAGEAVRAADRLRHAFEQPFLVEGRKVSLTASVGVALGGVAVSTTEDVLRDAHTALERAKESGRDATALFDEEMHRRAVERIMLESELAHALERGQLQMHYQPVFDLAKGRIAGFEALARWEHPELGLLLPAAFIPVAEETGSIHSLGRWSLREAVGALGRFTRAAGRELTMAVNCSPRQLLHPSFPDELEGFVAEAGVPPHLLRLEITEGSFVDRPELAAIVLARIRHLGIEVDLDDFGTGYSSLAYLLRLPVDAIKIDRSFVGGLPGTESAVKIAKTVLLLARSLGLAAIAEGVETPGQLEWLRDHGCDLAQGFLLGPPVPEAEIGDLDRTLAAS